MTHDRFIQQYRELIYLAGRTWSVQQYVKQEHICMVSYHIKYDT